jgi:4-hydroxymandelate oxidase
MRWSVSCQPTPGVAFRTSQVPSSRDQVDQRVHADVLRRCRQLPVDQISGDAEFGAGAVNPGRTARGGRSIAELPMFKGLEAAMNPPEATWEYVDRLKKLTRMKLMLKGIDTREDARLAREHGVDGIIVSNHGGRSLDTNRSTIEALSEVLDGAGAGLPVFIDGGFRRGTDIFKALAMGASAVGIGRPYLWGLSALGQQGVERVLDILRAELQRTMRQCGAPSVARITKALAAGA